MDAIERRLEELGLKLPPAPAPAANYLPYRISGKTLYLSGVLPLQEGALTHTGPVGKDQSVESACQAARICALNALAGARAALGSLEKIEQVLLVTGYVLGVPEFAESSQVVNGASDLLVEVLGEAGKHARAAVTVAGLPRNATVELQLTVSCK